MKRLLPITLLICVATLTGCMNSKRPSPFAWQGYYPSPPKQKFAYNLPPNGSWLDMKHARTFNEQHTVPERLKIIRGERPHDYSERFRELYIRESMDPVEFLSKVKSTDELRCLEVEVNILKKVQGGFVYLEKGKNCRKFPNNFISYGKVVSTPRGLSNLQYDAVPERLSGAHIRAMHDVIVGSKLLYQKMPASNHSKSETPSS